MLSNTPLLILYLFPLQLMHSFNVSVVVNLVPGELTKGSVFTTSYRDTELHNELEELQVSFDTRET